MPKRAFGDSPVTENERNGDAWDYGMAIYSRNTQIRTMEEIEITLNTKNTEDSLYFLKFEI